MSLVLSCFSFVCLFFLLLFWLCYLFPHFLWVFFPDLVPLPFFEWLVCKSGKRSVGVKVSGRGEPLDLRLSISISGCRGGCRGS